MIYAARLVWADCSIWYNVFGGGDGIVVLELMVSVCYVLLDAMFV